MKEMVVKIVAMCNYASGRRQEYLEWVKKVVPIFLAPPELKKMTAYTNSLGSSPHRLVEFEFEDMAAYAKWAVREKIIKATNEWNDISTNHTSQLFTLVYEKSK